MNSADEDALKPVLADRLQELARSSAALELSHRSVVSAETIDVLSRGDDGIIEIKALTGRFACVVDILVHKMLPTIDEIEGQESVLPLDRIQRAEKRGWVAVATDLSAARGLRNCIAHEYNAEGWWQIARPVCALVPSLRLSVEQTMTAGSTSSSRDRSRRSSWSVRSAIRPTAGAQARI
jgi:hypothetical protein